MKFALAALAAAFALAGGSAQAATASSTFVLTSISMQDLDPNDGIPKQFGFLDFSHEIYAVADGAFVGDSCIGSFCQSYFGVVSDTASQAANARGIASVDAPTGILTWSASGEAFGPGQASATVSTFDDLLLTPDTLLTFSGYVTLSGVGGITSEKATVCFMSCQSFTLGQGTQTYAVGISYFFPGDARNPPNYLFSVDTEISVTGVPEPTETAMMLAGLAGFAAWRRRRAA